MFSVIIPLYNKAKYIEKAVESVLNQTCEKFELIIVDDGSTDSSLAVASSFSDQRIQIISQANAGVSTARNNGVRAAKYEYIAFLDADDWWDSSFLMEMNQAILNFPDAALWGSSFVMVTNNSITETAILKDKSIQTGLIDYISLYARYFCMPFFPSSVVVKKQKFVAQGGFNRMLKMGEDFDLWIRLAIKEKIVLVNKPLSFYNQDVEYSQRGMVRKYYNPESYFAFQLDYLKPFEATVLNLKILLDYLKVISLEHYLLHPDYRSLVKAITKDVDFSNVPFKVTYTYKLPFLLAVPFYHSVKYMVTVKRVIKTFLQ